jgi:tetratricopeptide (TPR) repeat protein/DNA-binding CsgD family transcriptional regulator
MNKLDWLFLLNSRKQALFSVSRFFFLTFLLVPVLWPVSIVLAQSSADYRNLKGVKEDSVIAAIKSSTSDSEKVELYIKLMSISLTTDPQKTEKWFLDGIKLAEKRSNLEQSMRMNVLMLSGWNMLGQFEKTLAKAPPLERKIQQVKRVRTKLALYLAWANAASKKSEYDQAIKLYNKAIKLATDDKQLDVVIMALNNLAMMYNDISKWAEMKDLLNQVILLAQKNKMRPEETMGRFNLALVESNQGNYGKALAYLNESLRVFDSLGNKYGMALCYSSLGTNYQKTKAYDLALQSLRKGYAIRKQMGEAIGYAKVRRTMALVFMETSQLDSALLTINESIHLFDSLHSVADLQESYKIKSDILARKNDFANAFKALQQHQIWKDSMIKQSSDKQIQQQLLQIKATYTDSLTLARDQQLHRSRKGLYGLSALILGLLISGGIIGARWKRRLTSAQKNELDAKRQLTVAQAELSAAKKHLDEQVRFDLETLRARLTSETAWQESYWNEFLLVFTRVYPDFFTRLKTDYPELTPHELRVCALMKMNLSSHDLTDIMSITYESVRKVRYRIYKKIGLASDQELVQFMLFY